MEEFEDLPWSWKKHRTDEEIEEFYNKSFDKDYKDQFYCYLNEIEPCLIKHQYSSSSSEDGSDDSDFSESNYFEFIDPRTNRRVEKLFIDHSSSLSPKQVEAVASTSKNLNKLNKKNNTILFNKFPMKSSLTKEEHIACLNILKEHQFNTEVCNYNQNRNMNIHSNSKHYEIFNQTITKRNEEYKKFNQFIQEYFSIEEFKEKLLKRQEFLKDLYKIYLNVKAKQILNNANENYSIQSALPLEFNNNDGMIFKSYSITQTFCTEIFLTAENDEKLLSSRIEECCNLYKDYQSKEIEINKVLSDNQENSRNIELLKSIAIEKDIDCVIPENVLQFLICCNEYTSKEISWEIPFQVEDQEMKTIIIFDDILPLRSNNSQNLNFIYEQLFEILMTLKSKEIQNRKSSSTALIRDEQKLSKNSMDNELHAVNLNMNYNLIEFEKFLNNFYTKHKEYLNNDESQINDSLYPKTNFQLVEWSLGKTNDHNNFKILTKKRITVKNSNENCEINYSFKLENKKEFGAEIMKKNELIKEWLRHFLTPSTIKSYTKRFRIDIETLKPIMHEILGQHDIESELLRLWNIKTDQLMSNLYGFLTLLKNFPAGNYLLKCSSSHKNRILVYMKTEMKRSENDINLHDLYLPVTNDYILKHNEDEIFIPIDNHVITPLHFNHKILPSCFPHWIKNKPGQLCTSKSNKIIKNDRDEILEKFQKKKEQKLKKIEIRMKLRNAKRRKIKRLKYKKKLQQLNAIEDGFKELDAAF